MKQLIWILSIGALTLCMWTSALNADMWSSPATASIQSENGEWQAEIIPSKLYHSRDGIANAVLKSRNSQVEFELLNTWMPVKSYLLNDGRLFTFDNWGDLGGSDHVAALYTPQGNVLWKRSLQQLTDLETRRGAMHSSSSIHWTSRPLECSINESQTEFTVVLHDQNELVITLADGRSHTIQITDIGDDPKLLLNRGEALLRTREYDQAEIHLKHAIELSPTLLEAYRALFRVYDQQQHYQEAIAAFEEIRTVFKDYPQRHNLANLYCDLAKAYHRLGEFEQEETILRDAIALDTAYSYPVIILAHNLEAQNRADAIAPLYNDFYEDNRANKHEARWILKDIGDDYAEGGDHQEAIRWYLKVYELQIENTPLIYMKLAKSYEALENIEAAMATYQRLISDAKTTGKNSYYSDQAQGHIERLTQLID